MNQWPQSWAGEDKDVAVGKALVDLFSPFVLHLHDQAVSRKTAQRHLNNLWAIGGEIIRELNYDPKLRRQSPDHLLHDAIKDGSAPMTRDATDAEQQGLDATARKLFKFLTTNKPPTSR